MANENKNSENEQGGRTINEQLEVAGNQLVDRVKELVEQGNVRRLIIRNPEGRTLLEIPLTIGAVAGGALIFFNPVLAALGALAALVTRVTVEIVRDEPEATVEDVKDAVKNTKKKIEHEVEDVKNKLTD